MTELQKLKEKWSNYPQDDGTANFMLYFIEQRLTPPSQEEEV